MREIKDFDTEKKIFIGKVLNHINYSKLHARIYEELSNHMDDMYEDFNSTCDYEKEITKKVIDEMGDPDELGEQLKKANAPVLLRAKILKSILSVIIILLSPFFFDTIYSVGEEIYSCATSFTVEEAEQWIEEKITKGENVKFLTEVEFDGVVHRIYVHENQYEEFEIEHIYSVKLLGINIKNRFQYGHSTYIISDDYTIANLNTETYRLSDALFIYFNDPLEEYIKVEYISMDDDSKCGWSDYIKIPQNGTYENPQYVVFDCPDGYRWRNYKRFDKNKEFIEWE